MKFIAAKDVRAFDELYIRYHKRLYFFMLKLLNNNQERAEDFLQDIFLTIVERPELFDADKKFYTWVFTIAANKCRTEYRNLKPEISTDHTEVSGTYSNVEELIAQVDAGMFLQHLGRALDDLNFDHKETFILRFQEGFSIQEIAVMMNCSVGTVKSRIYYSTRKLANDLDAFKTLLKKN